MNCKQGDLAYIVRVNHPVFEEAAGHICRCVEQINQPISGEPGWIIDPPVRIAGRDLPHCVDRVMRPIRPQPDDATDEMVLIAGLPEQVAA